MKRFKPGVVTAFLLLVALSAILTGCGGGGEGNGGGGGGSQPTVPAVPAGLAATAGNAQVSLSWNASTGATTYHLKRSGTSGGPYTTVATPGTTSYTDTGLTNGTPYYYVVSAANAAGESANSSQVTATPSAPVTAMEVNIDALSNRHPISPFVYGVNFPPTDSYITDSGATLIRWGGNASTCYNWTNFATNAANDYYFINRPMNSPSPPAIGDSQQFVTNTLAAGGYPLMTLPMVEWVAKNTTGYSFSVAKYGPQCQTDPYNADAGDGVKLYAGCPGSSPQYITGNDPADAYVPLRDSPSAGDPAGTVYRSQWAQALAPDFGTAPHFYDMDNEIDIWSGTHRDIHPDPATEEELRDVYLKEARALKTWDSSAVRFGPVSCCWYFYWNPAAAGADKSAHGNIDFFPWWLNEVYWSDLIEGSRSLDVFDIHTYTENSTTGLTLAQQRALALRATRDWWDPAYTSEAWFGTNNVLSTDPFGHIPFRLPRLRALVNTIYPGTLLGSTEWNFAFAGEMDFSTALADADAYGILGRERWYAAARWTAPDPASAAYQTLKFYRNYDGLHDGFGTISVSATNTADPGLFSTYAALDATGHTLTVMVVNKDPQNAAQVQFTLNGFNPTDVTTYTLAPAANNQFTVSSSSPQQWMATQTFSPYTLSLLVISGSMTQAPAAEWDLNPESVMVPAGGTVTLHPKLVSGSGTVTLGSPQFDSGINSISITGASVTSSQNGSIDVTAGGSSGFYRFTITGTDGSGVAQRQSGWIVVGYPAATLTKEGDAQSGPQGTTLNLSVTLAPGASGGTATGAPILFSTDAGSLEGNGPSAAKVIVPTDNSGKAAVVLTLPATAATVNVTAEGPYGLGHPVAKFTETSQ
jgi:hypothetical protein